ncbi:DUF5060 domain-containing protein [Candidatus Latescibacterota bacterium]
MEHIAQWDHIEISREGTGEGNPFLDVEFGARFCLDHRVVEVDGFYDGEGIYRVRFMPDMQGEWRYTTRSSWEELDGQEGAFVCVAPGEGNRGPVHVERQFHFGYADGTRYIQVGTTCYAWAHQGDELEEQTLETLAQAPFNKIRMCVFPKDYAFNRNEPTLYPFARDAQGEIDLAHFSPAFWRHFEERVGQLRDLGIEADLILFHPYDRWGHARMPAEVDDRYLRYAAARLASFRNVWWSMANEYDLMKTKSLADWDRFFRIIQAHDPYQHLRGIHNWGPFYNHSQSWVTHVSVQHAELDQVGEWRRQYAKPVVVDECGYEGNIEYGFGNLTAQEMVHRFWLGTVRGGYVGHGETYLHPEDILWWSKGGTLHGQSPERIAFLHRILEDAPVSGVEPLEGCLDRRFLCIGRRPEYYLAYLGVRQPARVEVNLPEDAEYRVEAIDTWSMEAEVCAEGISGRTVIPFAGRPFMALRARKVR